MVTEVAGAVRNGGVRYSSPQSPGIGCSVAMAACSSRRSASVSENANRLRVSSMCVALAEPGADDHAGDAGLVEHVAAGDVGDRDAVPRGDGRCRAQHPLQRLPAARRRG